MALPSLGLKRLILKWRDNANGRTRLAKMPEKFLKDIGISRADAWRETQKPFWRN